MYAGKSTRDVRTGKLKAAAVSCPWGYAKLGRAGDLGAGDLRIKRGVTGTLILEVPKGAWKADFLSTRLKEALHERKENERGGCAPSEMCGSLSSGSG